MAMGWLDHISQRDRMYRKRNERLKTKAQKAGVIERLPEIKSAVFSWNKRFGVVASLRSGCVRRDAEMD